MLGALYNIIIFPLTQILEFFYQFIYEATGNEGVAVIGLSFVVTLCTLPLYMVAEGWQETERAKQEIMKPGIARIKKVFKGDEQYMILNTFYRQNHYNPIMALRSSLSLLIQIPFFITAYHFLSELGSLRGVSFLFVKDFGAPDATFRVGDFDVNILPIAMSLINCASGFIYSKGHELREKIQIYGFAAIFLVLLYNSPAGLVVYWTMNNILSLVKNIFYKLKNPKKVLYILLCVFAVVCIVAPFTILSRQKDSYKKALICFGCVLPFIPLLLIRACRLINKRFPILDTNRKLRFSVFAISAVLLALLSGVVIPSMIMESEPNNYCFVDSYKSPFIFLFTPAMQALGFFVFWPCAFYGLFSSRTKKIMTLLFSVFAIGAVVNCFAFGGKYGPIYPELIFMQPQVFTPSIKVTIVNTLALVAVFLVTVVLIAKKTAVLRTLLSIIVFSMGVVSIQNIIGINSAYRGMTPPSYTNKLEPIFHLSKTGKNVIVLMQDRCFSPFVPYVFDECEELRQKYDGFMWYPNTVSMGKVTMIGTPGLFAGYDYTPYQINQRPEKDLQTKHNEAMLSLPLLFAKNGYFCEVANLPYENYLEQPRYDMYLNNQNLTGTGIRVESHSDPEVNPYTVKYENHATIQHNDVLGTYTDYWYAQHNMQKDPYISTQILRNFIWFSFFKIVPPILRGGIYHRDYWMAYNKWDDSARFVDNYSIHDYLPELTDFYDDSINGETVNGSLIVIDNEATHEPILLQAPNYEYAKEVTNHGTSPLALDAEFSTMCGVFKRFGEFIDYLKENNVYDNTRIIIVSDHGMGDTKNHHHGATQLLQTNPEFPFVKSNFVATLMVKDFDMHGDFCPQKMTEENLKNCDMTFMTNADTPFLAAKDLIADPKNPFTHNALEVHNKADYAILNTARAQSTRIRKDTKFEVRNEDWYTVKDNIFVDSNWECLAEQSQDNQ